MLSPTVLIGEQKLPMKSVAVAQKVIIGGDIGLSLESAFKLASSGEFTLTATYGG
jgi:hypothetical protein